MGEEEGLKCGNLSACDLCVTSFLQSNSGRSTLITQKDRKFSALCLQRESLTFKPGFNIRGSLPMFHACPGLLSHINLKYFCF